MDAPRAPSTLRIGGISMGQYAAVRAALAEDHPLEAVLAIERIDPKTWRSAENAWQRRLVHDESARRGYESELAAAEDWLDRRVSPLDSDERAWASFLQDYTYHPSPSERLAALGLRVGDLGRLGRKWKARCAADPTLELRIAELRRSPGPQPALQIEPARLRPSRGASPQGPEPPAVGHVPSPETAPLIAAQDRAAALAAEWRTPDHRAGKLPTYLGVATRPVMPESAPESKPARPVPVGTKAPELPALSAAMKAFTSVDGTAIGAPASPELPALPFDPTASPQIPEPAPAWMPKGMRGLAEVDGTQLAPTSASGPALPFVESAAPSSRPAPARPVTFTGQSPPSVSGASAAPAAPRLSTEQYASLCVELELDPPRRQFTLERYGLNEAQHAQVAARFDAWFAAEPAARAAWERAFTTYRAWLVSGGRR